MTRTTTAPLDAHCFESKTTDENYTVPRNSSCIFQCSGFILTFLKNLVICSRIISINLFHCDLELNCTINV